MASDAWQGLRQGARNVAGVTYQVAVTVDLLTGGVADRPGHPPVVSVLPEAWEDIDVNLSGGGKLFVQVKERAPGSAGLGAAAVADVITHAAVGMAAAGQLHGSARIGLVTDCSLASGLVFTGWMATVTDRTEPGALDGLDEVLRDRLACAGLDPALSDGLLGRAHIVHRPWNHSEETQRDLAKEFSVAPAVAWLAFTVLVEHAARIAAGQRSALAEAPAAITSTDLSGVVTRVAAAVDVPSLDEAVQAGVCKPVDFLSVSDLRPADFLAGVEAAPSHIAADLDVVREEELASVLAGLRERHHVLIAGPSGSGKSALLWRAARILTLRARAVRVLRVSSDDDVEILLRHVDRTRPSPASPMVVCADNAGSPRMTMWQGGLARLLEIPGVYVITTVRREDYLPEMALDAVAVNSALQGESAKAVFAALQEAGLSLRLELEDAVERAGGLLMEFIALATTGQRLRKVLDVQLHRLRQPGRSLDRNVLRLVCAAHTLGWPADAGKLAGLLCPSDPWAVGNALSRLEGEHLIVQDVALGQWRGIHDLRAEIIQELLHQSPSPSLTQTMCEVIALLPPHVWPWAMVRGAELLACHCVASQPARSPVPERLLAVLQPLAARAGALFASNAALGEAVARDAAALLQAGIRLDAIAYAHLTLPLAQARCPSGIDPAEFARLLYTYKVNGVGVPNVPEAERLRQLAQNLPPFAASLSEEVARGIGAARLAEIAASASMEGAAELLEAAEGLIRLDAAQARQVWNRLAPALPAQPGDGFDTVSADHRARIASSVTALAAISGAAVAEVLGPVQERADDALACDPGATAVTLRLHPPAPGDDAELQRLARQETWSPSELLVAQASILCRDDITLPTGYRPLAGEGDGLNQRLVRACRRLLDACPEVDRADIAGVSDNWKPVGYGDMVFGRKSIRSGILRITPSVRRNIAYQAAVARMRTAESWSARVRQQAALAAEATDLLAQLPRRLRAHDNQRRAQEWAERVSAATTSATGLPRRPPHDCAGIPDVEIAASDGAWRAPDPEQDAFKALTQGLSAAAMAVATGARTKFHYGAHLLREAQVKLGKARAANTPVFAAIGDPLPADLDRLARQTERLLRACAAGDDARQLIAAATSDEQAVQEVAEVALSQERCDRLFLTLWLSARGISNATPQTISDPKSLEVRLNSTQTVAFVDLAAWSPCERALAEAPGNDTGEATGRLALIAVQDGIILPMGITAPGSAGSWLPIADTEEFHRIGHATARPVLNGPHLTLFRETIQELTAWSAGVQLRARRPPSWTPPPAPKRTPRRVRDELVLAVNGDPARSEAGLAMIGQLATLADSVASEDGRSPGLAALLADSVTTADASPDTDLIATAMFHAITADMERARTRSANTPGIPAEPTTG